MLGCPQNLSLNFIQCIVTSRALNGRDCEGAVHENIPKRDPFWSPYTITQGFKQRSLHLDLLLKVYNLLLNSTWRLQVATGCPVFYTTVTLALSTNIWN